MILWIVGTFIIAYVLGSIPFGKLLTQLAGYGDIRAIGSGNIGATNVFRTGNKWLGILTLLLDMIKGLLAVLLCRYFYGADYALLAALFAVIGHVFPVWLGFKGGKGVATAIGVLLGMNWLVAAVVCGLWLLMFALSRTSSVSSLLAIGYSPITAYIFDDYFTAMICLCIACIVIFTHMHNIIRLIDGRELSFKENMTAGK